MILELSWSSVNHTIRRPNMRGSSAVFGLRIKLREKKLIRHRGSSSSLISSAQTSIHHDEIARRAVLLATPPIKARRT